MKGIPPDVQLLGHALKEAALEAVLMAADKSLHQGEQQLCPQQEDLQAAQALALLLHRLHHPAGFIQVQIQAVPCGGGTHHSDVRAGLYMRLQHRFQIDIQGHIAVRQEHIVLPDMAQVILHHVQCLQLAPEAAVAPGAVIGEHRQQRQAAEAAGEIPTLAAAQVIHHALALAVHNDAHVPDAGVDHVREDEVHHPV